MIARLCYGKKDYPFNYSEFICDDESDLVNLPTNKKKFTDKLTCSVGSKALVVETSDMYILSPNNEWIKFVI